MSTSGETEQRHEADPGTMNGTTSATARAVLQALPRPRPAILLPAIAVLAAAFTAAAFLSGRRAGPGTSGGKGTASRRKPKNLLRYYGITILINALERESTRKAVLATLKWARQRA